MEICIFYSWQSKYRNNCDTIIDKALKKAVNELNKENTDIQYIIERGGGDVLGSESITTNIEKIIREKADLAFLDFTHVGESPQQDAITGEWKKIQCYPNPNVSFECGLSVFSLTERLVFKVYNTAYGDLNKNLFMHFDIRQAHNPLPFFCSDETIGEKRTEVWHQLAKDIKRLINLGTEEYLKKIRTRYAPLLPLRNEYAKVSFQSPFIPTKASQNVQEKISSGCSFRLKGLPGLGKTRMIVEAFRNSNLNVYYCDCRELPHREVITALEKLFTHYRGSRQIVILDNCDQRLCSNAQDLITENGFTCQLITVFYDPSECTDSGIETIKLSLEETTEVVETLVNNTPEISEEAKRTIIDLAGGFPLMAILMIQNYQNNHNIFNVKKEDVFNRMLGLDRNNQNDLDKLKVLTAFSIFKFIGLYGLQEKQGRFIAENKIITNIQGKVEDRLQLFKEVYAEYQNLEILERQGNLVLMRLIPLAIYLCRLWFQKQTPDSIAELIRDICECPDEGTRNMVMESLSRRITLLNDIPLAQELKNGLTHPDTSPFLTEEVVLNSLGSRLFLAFSEVDPEPCAIVLRRILAGKSDAEIQAIEPARRNIIWALDHLAFDHRSFKDAMWCLARLTLVETEDNLGNNSTGVFLERFAILLAGTEVNLQERIQVLEELIRDASYHKLVKKALLTGLRSGSFYRTGGAERQGTNILVDYTPSCSEIVNYYCCCLKMLVQLAANTLDIDILAQTLASNARGYYLAGTAVFLIKSLEEIAPKKDFIWEEMRDALSSILEYDANKHNRFLFDEIENWKEKLTKDDYVYRFFHSQKDIIHNYSLRFEEGVKKTQELYGELARELIDKKLYQDKSVMQGIFAGKCFYFRFYALELSSYSKEKGIQKELLDIILHYTLHEDTSRESEDIFIYFLTLVEDKEMLHTVYQSILESDKKYLLISVYAIKQEGEDAQKQLFDLLAKGYVSVGDFTLYFKYLSQVTYAIKNVINRLLDCGAQGAALVLSNCHNFLFDEKNQDYHSLGRKCLLKIDAETFLTDEFLYFKTMSDYLLKNHDEDLAIHIHKLLEEYIRNYSYRNGYYIERLYRKVLWNYTELLKQPLLKLLDDDIYCNKCVNVLRTSFSEDGDERPTYCFMSLDEWYEWIVADVNAKHASVAALMFCYAEGNHSDPFYLKLIENFWSVGVKDALSYRFHSYGWTGTGIPLYESRISICEDYIRKLSNEEAKAWFKNDISFWKERIHNEKIENAHIRAIYD